MTEEIYNKATYLRSIIEEEKKVLKYWKEAVDATEETIALSNALKLSTKSCLLTLSFASINFKL